MSTEGREKGRKVELEEEGRALSTFHFLSCFPLPLSILFPSFPGERKKERLIFLSLFSPSSLCLPFHATSAHVIGTESRRMEHSERKREREGSTSVIERKKKKKPTSRRKALPKSCRSMESCRHLCYFEATSVKAALTEEEIQRNRSECKR